MIISLYVHQIWWGRLYGDGNLRNDYRLPETQQQMIPLWVEFVHTFNCHSQNCTRRAIFRLGIDTIITNILVITKLIFLKVQNCVCLFTELSTYRQSLVCYAVFALLLFHIN